ncbi:hypothetical protein O3M35_012136 [Rhynocoris fuscipes]|uniref:Apolipoprotein D n=1 Tax=Rhynocoris fuscipes TaxID=488301 RepID=A0AAW1CR91_9HEMI
MHFKIFLFLLTYNLFYITIVNGQAIKFGSCLVPPVKQDFEYTQFFVGKWYKQKGFGTLFYDLVGKCPTVEFKITSDGQVKSLDYTYSAPLQTYISKFGKCQLPLVDNKKGYYEFTFDVIQGLITEQYPMYIIDTDYDNYAITYFCRSLIGFMKIEASWVMTRSRDGGVPNEDTVAEIVNKSGLKYSDFKTEINNGCGPNEPSL